MQAPSAMQESQSTATIVPCIPKGTYSSPRALYASCTTLFVDDSASDLPGPPDEMIMFGIGVKMFTYWFMVFWKLWIYWHMCSSHFL